MARREPTEVERMRTTADALQAQGRTRDALKLRVQAAKKERAQRGVRTARKADRFPLGALVVGLGALGVGVALAARKRR